MRRHPIHCTTSYIQKLYNVYTYLYDAYTLDIKSITTVEGLVVYMRAVIHFNAGVAFSLCVRVFSKKIENNVQSGQQNCVDVIVEVACSAKIVAENGKSARRCVRYADVDIMLLNWACSGTIFCVCVLFD